MHTTLIAALFAFSSSLIAFTASAQDGPPGGPGATIDWRSEENNIPTIGEELVRRGREMQWIRIERYVEEQAGVPRVRHLPMLCQHCGAAPCEAV